MNDNSEKYNTLPYRLRDEIIPSMDNISSPFE
jgi:hypothetical protein